MALLKNVSALLAGRLRGANAIEATNSVTVPKPGTLSLLALGAAAMLGRRPHSVT